MEQLIVKFINQDASIDELEELLEYLSSEENVHLFKAYVKINYYSIYLMNDFDNADILNELKKKIEKEKLQQRSKTRYLNLLKYAAICVVLVGIGFYVNVISISSKAPVSIIPKEDKVTLTTSTGKMIILEEVKNEMIDQDVELADTKDELVYTNKDELNNVTHKLEVPYGKRFNIVLSDGTRVYLNSGSELTYPVTFESKGTREVMLIGEAYFDVKSSSTPFIVRSNAISVQVFGTEFNFLNFPEDEVSDVVLVEGSIGIKSDFSEETVKLLPGQIGKVNKQDYKVETERVNTNVYTSWINGEVVFRNERFSQILKKLERLYNVTIINNKMETDDLFNASIDLENESIEEVLSYFGEIYSIDYQIFKNKVIIN